MTKMSSIVLILFLFCSTAHAIGGTGAVCNPNESAWGNCNPVSVFFESSVSNTVQIPSGYLSTHFLANKDNTRYVLQGDVVAAGTAITIAANYVIIDLNGHTITYNDSGPGEGVNLGAWNKHHVAITNGSIVQGKALSEGDEYGRGNNPVSRYNSKDATNYQVSSSHIANLYVRYGGRDVAGIFWTGSGTFEQNTIEDTFEFGTLKNRHQGIDALKSDGGSTKTYRNNTIINARHRGINSGNDAVVHGNHIKLRSIATNAVGISSYAGQNIKVYNNTIIGRGEHPIGVSFGAGAANVDIYSNYIDVEITALGSEYGGDFVANPTGVHGGNFAAGFRTTWGANDLNFYDNEIMIKTNSKVAGTYSPTGQTAYIDGGGKGLFVGIKEGEKAAFYNNTISVIDHDGTGRAFGMTCSYNFSDGLSFLDNTVTSNVYNMVVGDGYGKCDGYPLIKGNKFIKSGDFARYKTIINEYNAENAKARFVDNIYQNGASKDSRKLDASGGGVIDIYFGNVVDGENLYNYQLHDASGTSTTLLHAVHNPALVLPYMNPAAVSPITPPVSPPMNVKLSTQN